MITPLGVRSGLFRNGAQVPIVSRIATKITTPRAVSLTPKLYRLRAAASGLLFPGDCFAQNLAADFGHCQGGPALIMLRVAQKVDLTFRLDSFEWQKDTAGFLVQNIFG